MEIIIMEKNNKSYEELINFIKKESYLEDISITNETEIENDLGITGDDAVELLIKYGKVFNVDVTNFMAADYFDGEGDFLAVWLRKLKLFPKQNEKTLTVGDLEKGRRAGKLDEVVIASSL